VTAETGGLEPRPVPEALALVTRAPRGLLALGIPRCGACMLLPVSLAEIQRARPDLTIAIGEFATPEDWLQRERLLWPRGIHVSRSSVPALALLVDGVVVASRPGAGPAEAIERWLALTLGPAAHPLPAGGATPAELSALDALAGHIAHQRSVKWRSSPGGGA
jgi:DNA-binding transcriptional LysR family regulator